MILYRYILKNHVAPFIYSIVTLMLIFLLQFMMKFADRLVGKGLSIFVIAKLVAYNLAWMVVLVVPMATLIATLMAFGTMSQNNEITVMKSSGISLYKMMLSPLLMSVIIGYLLLLFNNDVLPDANHQAKILMEDISRKKPTLSLEPGVFSQEVSNYAILVRGINKKTNALKDVLIYDYSDPTKLDIVTAKKGKLYFSKDQTKLIMDLWDGQIHESDLAHPNYYRKMIFTKDRIAMNASQFTFQQTGPGVPRGDRELSAHAMLKIIDSLDVIRGKAIRTLNNATNRYLYEIPNTNLPPINYSSHGRESKELVYIRALNNVRTAQNIVLANYYMVASLNDQISQYWVEVHKKYAIPVACIIFVLIGAPLGIMVKKGGFGAAASISLFFFLLYWAFLIGGEKLADRDLLSPFWGMWSANILLGIAGIILTTKTVQETVKLNFVFLKKFVPKQWRNFENENSINENS